MSLLLRTKPVAVLALCACVAALAVSACGSSSSSTNTGTGMSATTTATTSVTHPDVKFVLHAGLAFGAFHRYIYKPFEAGDFSHPLEHKLATIKAGVAAAFVYRELKEAIDAAKGSPTLSKLVAPLTDLTGKVSSLVDEVKSGGLSQSSISAVQNGIGSISSQSSGLGAPITEIEKAL